ncbi:small multidrug efflux protein [Microbacterium sp. zg-YB36]|uniref:small multidrug efflux protein n=1 Tax=Microbacterium sp. zg-YB36 TaxID=2969407 RepID=UPI00214A94E6|nr:small multidrug efflux protein [Microbacterium sp. zg-YB36]MDL5350237.1 small multidrug efflux protein [Microbacterium sp. zg-YB36]
MSLIDTFQDLVAQVPDLVQPLILALAGAVPFIEGEGAATIGIIGGIHPVVAVIAGAAGNFLCVAVLVLLSSGARTAVVTRRSESVPTREAVAVGGGSALEPASTSTPAEHLGGNPTRRAKFLRALDRYGVPGVSLLGPLLLPTQFTATMLAAVGVGKARILVWQALAIIGWTTIIAVLITGVVNAVG